MNNIPPANAVSASTSATTNNIPAAVTFPNMLAKTPAGGAIGVNGPAPPPMGLPSTMPKAIVNSGQTQRAKMQNVPAFLNKLYNMVDDPSSDDLIRWADDGTSFIVLRQEEFAKRVLPRFFKHSNFSSFVRQLNMYGFHKVPHLQQGSLQDDGSSSSERWEFSNPHFQRNQPDLLLLVTRKKGRDPTASAAGGEEKESATGGNTNNIDMHHILDEIAAIKKHQMSISTDLRNIQQDNQVLWQETLAARERHHRHQETIDKILRFLASVFSNDKKRMTTVPRKRRFLIGDANTEYKEEDTAEDPASDDDTEEDDDDNADEERQEEEGETSKRRRRRRKVPEDAAHFDINEYVNNRGAASTEDDATTATKLPYSSTAAEAIAGTATSDAPASELAAAIALNDETKQQQKQQQQAQALRCQGQQQQQQQQLQPEYNLQQLLGLQNLLSLVQTNPAVLNQPTEEAFYNAGLAAAIDYGNPAAANGTSMQDIQQSIGAVFLNTPPPSGSVGSSQYPAAAAAATTGPSANSVSLPQVTNNLSSVAKTADTVNQEIDLLGSSLYALASQLGFDPAKHGGGNADSSSGYYMNIDDFLNQPPGAPSSTNSSSKPPCQSGSTSNSSTVISSSSGSPNGYRKESSKPTATSSKSSEKR